MPEQPTRPASKTTSAKDQFTIADKKTRAVFISQAYEKREDADARLVELKKKFGDKYDLAVVRVDSQGGLHSASKDE